jgi:hypothetical protein
MLSVLKPWKPSEEAQLTIKHGDIWEVDVEDTPVDRKASYII